MGTRAPEHSTNVPVTTAVCAWARETLGHVTAPEATASVRVRLSPSPEPGKATVLLPWDGERTRDRAADALEDALEDVGELPDPVKVRIELLDGSGTPIKGAGMSRTWSNHMPVRQEESPNPTATAAPSRPVLDAEWSPAELGRPVASAFNTAEQLTTMSGPMVQVPMGVFLGFCMLNRQADHALIRQMSGTMVSLVSENRLMTDIVRRGQAGLLEHAETMGALAIDAIPKAARAEADVELAATKAEGKAPPKTALQQATDLFGSYGKFMKDQAEAEALRARARGSKPEAKADPTPEPKPDPAPANGGQKETASQGADSESGPLSAILSSEVPAELAADLLLNDANPHKARILDLVRAMAKRLEETP